MRSKLGSSGPTAGGTLIFNPAAQGAPAMNQAALAAGTAPLAIYRKRR
jgi:hypothetical protein